MDAIDRAIERQLHISARESFRVQSWDMLWDEACSKKLFLFGAGAATEVFFQKMPKELSLEGIIDNSPEKQGLSICDLSSAAWENLKADVVISGKAKLNAYLPEDTVILISSLNYYEQIADDLEQMGFLNIYSLLAMESKERIEKKETDYKELSVEEIYKNAHRMYGHEPLQRKIVFRAFGDYADHEKYITEALLRTGEDIDLVWLVSDLRAEVPAGVRVVWYGNPKKMFYELITAKMWIADVPMFEYLEKRQGQIYVQTKHWASVTLKRFYLDTVAFKEEPEKLALWDRESRIIDHIVVGSQFDKESCKRGFAFDGEFWETGSPRSDAMFREEDNKEKVRNIYHIDENTKMLLYAPTYRFSAEQGNSVHESKNIGLDYRKVKSALEKRFGGEWIILLRLHPSVKDAFKDISDLSFVIDVSMHADSQELASAADVTISDYSSIMFEPAFVGKPVFLFATDKAEYINKEYDLLIDYEKLPFSIAESNEELQQVIQHFDVECYKKNLEAFFMQYGVKEDGRASERTAEFILKAMKE